MRVRKNVRPAALAQLDRVFGYEPKGQGFESLTPRQKWGCLKCNKKHLRQFLFCVTEKDFAEVKKKASKRGKKEYDKKEDR